MDGRPRWASSQQPGVSSTNPPAPDQRNDRRDVLMTRSLETLMAAEPDAAITRVLEMLDECVPLEEGYRCVSTRPARSSARGPR